MLNLKPWYLSRTIWASVVTMLVGGAGLAGLPLDGIDNSALTDTILQAITALSGLVAIFGRLAAKQRIGKG
ncbi:hypothetical protein ACFFTN_01850 [Aminobacter aganoensis]|uniref:Membrane protein n=2 Tax=Aminobacter TaxID=31988 RepID=A0ABR6L6H7_9HYPH|nr:MULTISPECIES: hypothetical protein [Aminobacter]AWC24918.1 hypothetical protein CO731_04410 [Aminobacter sp. MSH1]KQU67007.1 hypothetical protein ASC75_10130 [Aminobacter sp. DSM 101952]MBB4651809.1 putative membrane protein [Aminobacter niigataensis]MBB6353393.1 putative membrane protein [Aminobacter aganoensis]CAI2935664.1 conserved protein of unknown function [Aminobacter niigataensis]